MSYKLLIGDCRQRLADVPTGSVQTCITSPPYYGLRDYGHGQQIGLETTPKEFIDELVGVFREARRALADDGTLWVNMGDSYAHSTRNTDSFTRSRTECAPGNLKQHGLKVRDLMGMPWRLAFALQDDGWYLRQDIIWHKPNPMPESVTSRCTKSHEYIFLLSKSPTYYFDNKAIQEPATGGLPGNKTHKHTDAYEAGDERARTKSGLVAYAQRQQDRPRVSDSRKELRSDIESRHRSTINGGQSLQADPDGFRNKRSVWTVPTAPFAEAHFATYPPALILPCVLAGSRPGDTVLDPFNGAGTTGLVALENGRHYVGIELNPDYAALTRKRLARVQMDMFRSQPAAA